MFNFNGAQANVAISGVLGVGLPAPSTGQSIIVDFNLNAASGNTLYTVTTGKTFYVTDIIFTDSSVSDHFQFAEDSTVKLLFETTVTDVHFNTPVPFASGKAIVLGCSGNVTVTLIGFEQ